MLRSGLEFSHHWHLGLCVHHKVCVGMCQYTPLSSFPHILGLDSYICTCAYVMLMCICVTTCIGHKLSRLPVALGWSCGAQCVGFDAGSGEKIRAQDESPKAHRHHTPLLKVNDDSQRTPSPAGCTLTPGAALPAAWLQRSKTLSRRWKQLLMAAKHSGNTGSSHHCRGEKLNICLSCFIFQHGINAKRLKHRFWLESLQKDWCLQHNDFN